MSETYLEQVLDGEAIWTDIEDFVGAWHDGNGLGQELHDYLGMTWNEYALWVERPDALRAIIASHELEEPLEELLERSDDKAVAARGLTQEDAKAVREWLRQTGRLPG
ncbi:MAG TPA: hypothetical protein VN892_04270 [Solirubrobacteraceae bacterium]|jgi:hypothetical protein|nr:hypothetical protein [Solirubrobacteraceae bacterium]